MTTFKYLFFLMIFITWSCQNAPKTAYVDNYKLFEGFKGKLELEARYKKDGLQKQSLLDSMKVQVIALRQSTNASREKIIAAEEQYAQFMAQFNQEIETQKAKYTDEVWKQINQYTFDFGKEKGYEYIFGSAGNGSLMYAASAKDITNEVLAYINKRYEGK